MTVGERFDARWEVQVLLGSGTTAHVYAGKHIFGFDAALKVLHPRLATNERHRATFLEQGYFSNQVRHPCLVRVFNDGECDAGPYLVMDRVRGESLESRLKRQGRLPTAVTLDLAASLLGFLAFIHGEGLFHRRLNPSEILIEPSGQIRVIDFDSANGFDTYAHRAVSLAPPTSRTATYFPPELGEADSPNSRRARSGSGDIWAVGAVLYRALAGRAPFAAEVRSPGTLDFATHRKGLPLAQVRDDLPEALCAAVERALAEDPSARFESAAAMSDALRAARAHLRVPA